MELEMTTSDGVWTVASGRYRCSDAELLKTGLLADVEVHCVETKRVWKAHKIILCSRSEWFKKALTGKIWEEGRTGIVKISETPEKHIDLVLTFIYTGTVNLKESFGQEHAWISSMKVWKLADFFCLDELRRLALKGRDDASLHWIKTYAWHLNRNTLPEFPPGMRWSIVASITALYRDARDDADFRGAFKSHLLGTAIAGISLVSQSAAFFAALRRFPELGFDWFLKLMSCVGAAGVWHFSGPRGKRLTCGRCGARRLESEMYPNVLKWNRTRVKEVVCEACFPMRTLENFREI